MGFKRSWVRIPPARYDSVAGMFHLNISRTASVHSIAIAIFFVAGSAPAADSEESIELNKVASTFALQLINQGNVIADSKGAWAEHRPSANKENEFIRIHGFAE